MKIKLYYWSPNGTNDAEIINDRGEVVDCIEELTFGVNINAESEIVPLKRVLKNIAVSPVDDGKEKLEQLSNYFPTLKTKLNKIRPE